MAKIKVRHLVVRDGRRHLGLPRYFWQPSQALRKQGWALTRLPAEWESIRDPAELELKAIAEAEALNRQLDEARAVVPAPAAKAPRAPQARTVDALIRHYKTADLDLKGMLPYRELRDTTRRGYDQALDRIKQWAGDHEVGLAFTTARLKALKRAGRKVPAMTNAILRVVHILLRVAKAERWLRELPEEPSLLPVDPSGLIWPREAVLAFVAAADKAELHSIGTAIMLNEWIGQRQGDVLRMPRTVYRGGDLVLRQSKTRDAVSSAITLPIGMVPELALRLEQELARQSKRFADAAVKPTALIVCEATGRAWKADHFRHAFAEVRAAMAKDRPRFEIDYLPPGRDMEDKDAFVLYARELQFMHLRHTAVTRLAEAGCETGFIAAVSGHSEKSIDTIIERYRIKTRKLARLAFEKRLDAETPSARPDVAAGLEADKPGV